MTLRDAIHSTTAVATAVMLTVAMLSSCSAQRNLSWARTNRMLMASRRSRSSASSPNTCTARIVPTVCSMCEVSAPMCWRLVCEAAWMRRASSRIVTASAGTTSRATRVSHGSRNAMNSAISPIRRASVTHVPKPKIITSWIDRASLIDRKMSSPTEVLEK